MASVGHVYKFAASADSGIFSQVLAVVIFTVPGVLVGGQIGPRLQARLNADYVTVGIAFLFMAVGVFMLTTIV